MIPASRTTQRPADARLLVIDEQGGLLHAARARLIDFLRPGDLVVANDAATLPGSLQGTHDRTGRAIEVRLAGRSSLAAADVHVFSAIVFGAGDFHTRTEDRPLPPPLHPGDTLTLGPLTATVLHTLGHPRLAAFCFSGSADKIWAGIAWHGRPIQYAHLDEPLAMWDVWTPLAAAPAAFEPPSAGFALDWTLVKRLRQHGIGFATITHAAGISSTGDAALDARLPFDEPYDIPRATARAIAAARAAGSRIVAIGTTVVRALEDAVDRRGDVRAGAGIATGRVTAASCLQVVDVLLSGVHEPGTSHYELMRAFVDDDVLRHATREMTAHGYRTHEFGDSVLISAAAADVRSQAPVGRADFIAAAHH